MWRVHVQVCVKYVRLQGGCFVGRKFEREFSERNLLVVLDSGELLYRAKSQSCSSNDGLSAA